MSPWVVWLAAAAVVFIPGVVIRATCGRRSSDALAAAGESAALGIAFWPVAFLVSSVLMLRWNTLLIAGAMTLLTSGCVAILIHRRQEVLRKPRATTIVGVAIAVVVAWTRIGHIEGIALPLWVDSVHHTMIVRLLLDHGVLPTSYEPFIAGSTFYYHWGFHALAATVAWLAGVHGGDAIAQLLLHFGQFLNVLTFFAVYAVAKSLFRSRHAALFAATLATLVSFFPAYYVSWGRYTQLCGLLLLPVAAALFWETGRRRRRDSIILLALVSAGLLLIHVRVAAVFAVLALVLASLLALQQKWRGLARCTAAAAIALIIAAPWMVRLTRTPEVRTLLAPGMSQQQRWETSNATPPDLLWAPNNLALMTLATAGIAALAPLPAMTVPLRVAGLVWWAALIVLLERGWRQERKRLRRFDGWRLSVVAVWVLLTLVLTNGELIGLPRVRIVPNSAAIIMLFLPLSLIGGHLIRWAVTAVAPPLRRSLVSFALAGTIAVAGALTMVQIINPTTVLATEADRRALAWIRESTPGQAHFAVGVQPWIGGSFIGNDGGYWISVVADRASILPPGLYAWVMRGAPLDSTTTLLERWYAAQQTGDVSFLAQLRLAGVDHLYFGPHNQTPFRAAIRSRLSPLYSAGGVDIYALR